MWRGCMLNAWNAKWAGTVESWIDCIPNRMHIDTQSSIVQDYFAELPARQ